MGFRCSRRNQGQFGIGHNPIQFISAAAFNAVFSSSAVTGLVHRRLTTDILGVGTRMANPFSFPFNSEGLPPPAAPRRRRDNRHAAALARRRSQGGPGFAGHRAMYGRH